MSTKRLHRRKTIEKAQEIHDTVYDPFANFEGNKYELFVSKLFYRIRDNMRVVLAVLGIGIVALIGIVSYDIYDADRENKALLAYEALQKNPVMTGAADPTVAIRKLDDYMAEHTTKSAKKRALLHKLQLLESAHKSKEAAGTATQISELLGERSLKVYMDTKAAILYEDAGETGLALTAAEKALSQSDDEGQIKATLLFLQARLLRANGKESAVRQTVDSLMKLDDKTNPDIIPIKQAALVFLLDQSASGR